MTKDRKMEANVDRVEQNIRWSAPTGESIKINTDVVINQKENRAGWGMVARNKNG